MVREIDLTHASDAEPSDDLVPRELFTSSYLPDQHGSDAGDLRSPECHAMPI